MYTEFFILVFAFLDVYKYLKLFNFCYFFYNFLFLAGTLKFAFFPLKQSSITYVQSEIARKQSLHLNSMFTYCMPYILACFRQRLRLQSGGIGLQACTTTIKFVLYFCMLGHLSMVLNSFESLLDLEAQKDITL